MKPTTDQAEPSNVPLVHNLFERYKTEKTGAQKHEANLHRLVQALRSPQVGSVCNYRCAGSRRGTVAPVARSASLVKCLVRSET